MNNKLFIAVCVTTFSGITSADYSALADHLQTHCNQQNTELCQKAAAHYATAMQHAQQFDSLKTALEQEAQQFATQNASNILEAAEQQAATEAQHIATELNNIKPQE